ncbi:MAG TPA: hypothetical protein VFI09_04755 [Solirubrobacterales bacterium]|nr:hypothetical protein [Solirubrobacterales bacterium]
MRFKHGHCLLALGLSALWGTSPAVCPANAADANFNGTSADGSIAVFSTTDKLVPGDTDSKRDVYQRSFDSGVGAYVTREASSGPTGGNDAYDATFKGVSADGREVFFSTEEPLVDADRDRSVDVYAHDTTTGKTVLVSRAASSCESGPCGSGTATATYRGASADGLKVFFETSESLTPADGDEASDVYMRDLAAEPPETVLVSQPGASCSGSCGDGSAEESFAGASSDGDTVFFETTESMTSADGDSTSDIYMRDLGAPAVTTLVSTAGTCPPGVEAAECRPKLRGVSATGSRAFFTTSEQLSGADTDLKADVYVWEGGAPILVSFGPSGGNGAQPASFRGITPDGHAIFFQTAEKLTADDEDGSAADVYVRDLTESTTTLASQADPSCAEAGGCGEGPLNASFAGASEDGNTVFFQTDEILAAADTDAVNDVYARDIGAGTTALVSRPAPDCEGEACGAPLVATFAAASASGGKALFSTDEPLAGGDEDEENDVYLRDLGVGSTTLESRSGICPLAEEKGCDSTFAGASEDLAHVFFHTVERLTADDVDSDLDVYEREGGQTRLVSAGNSVTLGPSTPVLSGTSPAAKGQTTTPSVLGHADPDTSIKLYTTGDCSGEAVAGSVAELEGAGIAVSVATDSTTSFRATATDENGDTSGCSNAVSYRQEDSPLPPVEEGGVGEEGESGGGGGSSGSGVGGSGPGSSPTPPPGPAPAPAPTYGEGIAYVAPVTRITFGPAFRTRARRPVFGFADVTGQPGTSFICRVDRRRWRHCSSPVRLKHLRGGKHVFRVKARNAVGVWEARPTKRVFKLVRRRR